MSNDQFIKTLDENDENIFQFTSEYVGSGHPDKLADQISDSILDACLKIGIERCAIETAIFQNNVVIFGECGGGPLKNITNNSNEHFLEELINIKKIVQDILKNCGYDDERTTDWRSVNVKCYVIKQSENIEQAVLHGQEAETTENQAAGDQGIMFGYATNETKELMPLTLILARDLCKMIENLRQKFAFLRSDCKSQVTVNYFKQNGALIPLSVKLIVLSVHHAKNLTSFRDVFNEEILRLSSNDKRTRYDNLEHLNDMDLLRLFLKLQIQTFVLSKYEVISKNARFLIEPSGLFEIGGPMADSGLTGRKTICDGYGGFGSSGGGAFSGKDWTKVDRTGAYAARWIAVSLIKAGFCKRVNIQLAYVIGLEDVVSIFVDTYGTGSKSDAELTRIIRRNFDLKPNAIANALDLKKIKFETFSVWGHFGRENVPWEVPKKLKFEKN